MILRIIHFIKTFYPRIYEKKMTVFAVTNLLYHLKNPLIHLFRQVATRTSLPIRYHYRDELKYGIYAASSGLVKANALESARVAILRKTKNKQIYMIKAHVPVTKKPLGTRMGKGKGKVDHYVAHVKTGKIMFEYNSDNAALAVEAFRQATNRLPVKTHFRVKPLEKKEIWTKF